MKVKLFTIIAATLIFAACSKQHSEKQNTEAAEQDVAIEEQSAPLDANLAPDFTLNDINGKPFTLSSLKGKYVVLDFWGSWCKWCIKGMPDMKDYYTKYSGKFEIVGIDCGDSESDWKTAVKKNDLPWLHVYNPDDSLLTEQYSIEGYPTKIIVAPDGCIYKVFLGEDPAFYEELDKLFAN